MPVSEVLGDRAAVRVRLSEMRAGERFAEVVAGACSVFAPDWMTDLEKSEMASAVIASAVAYVRTKNLARQSSGEA